MQFLGRKWFSKIFISKTKTVSAFGTSRCLVLYLSGQYFPSYYEFKRSGTFFPGFLKVKKTVFRPLFQEFGGAEVFDIFFLQGYHINPKEFLADLFLYILGQ